ncbi:MAG: hypothetical protein H8E56_01045 [Candidatus Marinimicrobia bacterium]|nr:hypothetical protein [Candidatus Neomarinimicrobiota bacterium]
MLFGHRGLLNEAPENTQSAYEAAVSAGLPAIELDVVQTKDGEIICSHNFDLERETDGLGYIFNKTWPELKNVNAGVHHGEQREPIPRLIDILRWLPTDYIVNIEIKTHKLFDISTPIKVAKIIQQKNRYKTTIVSSFNPVSLRIVKNIAPKIVTGFLLENVHLLSFMSFSKANFLHPRADVFNNQIMDYCDRHNLGTKIWTVNTGPGMAFLIRRGAGGIITDHPEVKPIEI